MAPFLFLSDEEFAVLALRDKAAYLVRANRELESRQVMTRNQMRWFTSAPKDELWAKQTEFKKPS